MKLHELYTYSLLEYVNSSSVRPDSAIVCWSWGIRLLLDQISVVVGWSRAIRLLLDQTLL